MWRKGNLQIIRVSSQIIPPTALTLVGETSQPTKMDEPCDYGFPEDISGDEASSPSEGEIDFEDLSEDEGSSHNNRHDKDVHNITTKERPLRRKMFRRCRREKIKKALLDFRSILEGALNNHSFFSEEEQRGMVNNLKDITLWGVPLLPSKGHEGTNKILLKFLKARGYRVYETLAMLRQTLIWRAKEGIDNILEEKLGDEEELDKVVFIDSADRKGHPLCFHQYGAFRNKAFYKKIFGSEKSRREFLRWRVQFMEKTIKKLSFKVGGVDSFVLISDMSNAPGPGSRMKELGPVSKDAVSIFQQYYPELIFKHIIINVPFWSYMYHGLVRQYCTHGTRKKFVFSRPRRATETLLKYIPPENIPIQYGGLRREEDKEFTSEDTVLDFGIRAGAVSTFQLPVSEEKMTIVWEVMVLGWDVVYKDEFIPDDEGSYNILLHKEKKIEETVRNSFYINEPGKILISIKNATYIKKKMFIRYKTKVTLPVYTSTNEQSR